MVQKKVKMMKVKKKATKKAISKKSEKKKRTPRSKRIARLLLNEIERVVDNVEFRRDLLFKIWSGYRTRKPFISTLKSGYFDLPLTELADFQVETLISLEAFYRNLDQLTFYIEYTEDMPTTMKKSFDIQFEKLKNLSLETIQKINENELQIF
ncbi:MAG: hypothetical protein ABIA04_03895 [Pseudomonadota bacterium]